MLPHRRRWPILLLLICIVTQVGAWAPETRVRMADEAVRFMPPSLRQALETHRTELLRGVLNPMKSEDEPDHRVSGGGTLDQRIAAEAVKLQTMLREATPFPRIARPASTIWYSCRPTCRAW